MNIIGIHTGHDAALSLIKDGRLHTAISMERLSRIKKDAEVTKENFDLFLDKCGITLDDVDAITMAYWDHGFARFMRIYSPENEKYPLSIFGKYGMESAVMNHLESYWRPDRMPQYVSGVGYTLPDVLDRLRPPMISTWSTFRPFINLNVTIEGYDRVIPGYFIDHHIAHAASTFFTSPYKKVTIFTADASMFNDTSCSGYFWGIDNRLNYFRNPGYMWGNFYDVATEFCGLGPGTLKAGTLMGLSSYGTVSKNARDNWEFWTRPQHEVGTEAIYYDDWLFLQISGKYPYIGDIREEIDNNEPGSWHYTREYQYVYPKEMVDSKEVMDIAADIQYVTERSLVKYSEDLYNESKTINDGNLCLAGGTFLNCNANYKIKTETSFDNVHIFPACGDDGVTVGSSLFALHTLMGYKREVYQPKDLMYLGFEYDHQPESPYKSMDLDLRFVAEQIAEGKIVCWFQGRSEFGPRALGSRSFISDPRRVEMKDILNSRVKFREWFRPFAPVVLKEHKEEWFDMDFDSPFMLHTVPCKRPTEIPSAVHIDNTSRVQTIDKSDNERFYDLIYNFYELTGVPVVMNTSLNIKGQPIVETPEDVMELFVESDVDVLVINDKVYLKE